MANNPNPAEGRDGYKEVPRTVEERAAAKSTYFTDAADPTHLRDVSERSRQGAAGIKVGSNGRVQPVGAKAGGVSGSEDAEYKLLRTSALANAVLPEAEALVVSAEDSRLREILSEAEAKANTRRFSALDPDSPERNRHVDEIFVGSAYYSTGQNTDYLDLEHVAPSSYEDSVGVVHNAPEPTVKPNGYPAFTANGKEDGGPTSAQNYDLTGLSRSNWAHSCLNIRVKDGKLAGLSFDGKEFPVSAYHTYAAQTARAGQDADRYVEELVKRIGAATDDVDKKSAFYENTLEPEAVLRLMHDVVLDTGAHMLMAARTLHQALAYQSFNQKAKTGGDESVNLQRMITDGVADGTDPASLFSSTDPFNTAFGTSMTQAGGIGMFYKERLSRSKLRNHALMITDPNAGIQKDAAKLMEYMGSFFAHRAYLEAVREDELYSTIEGEVGPANPIFITTNQTVISPMDWNKFCPTMKAPKVSRLKQSVVSLHGLVSPVVCRYTVDDNVQAYIGVGHPIVTGIFEALLGSKGSDNFRSGLEELIVAYGSKDSEYTIRIPVEYSTVAPTPWQVLLARAAQYIASYQEEYLKALVANKVIPIAFDDAFPDAVRLTEGNVLAADCFVNKGYDHALVPGVMGTVQRLRYLLPEDFGRMGRVKLKGFADGMNTKYVSFAPWYMLAEDFQMGASTKGNTVRVNQTSDAKQMHVQTFGIVGLRTDKVTNSLVAASPEEVVRAYHPLIDLHTANEQRLCPYARTKYWTPRVLVLGTSDYVTLDDVWKSPRMGYCFKQMPVNLRGCLEKDGSGVKYTQQSLTTVFSQIASPWMHFTQYLGPAADTVYGGVIPSDYLEWRQRVWSTSFVSCDVARRPLSQTRLVLSAPSLDAALWPCDRSISGAKNFESVDGNGYIQCAVGMLVDLPLFTYFGTQALRPTQAELDEETNLNYLVDPFCELYAAGLAGSVTKKKSIRELTSAPSVPAPIDEG